MRQLRSQEEIMASWKGELDKPVVSICCIVYNHEPYIEDALEGFLIQETDFPYEILIHDDASTDHTADIIRGYAAKYPKLIKTVCQTDNQFSQGRRWFQFLLPMTSSAYIATCEGDDFWTDPKKLQIQVDFLERNPEYVISGHDARVIDESGAKVKDSKLPDVHKRDYSSDELINGKAWILTMSWVYRNVIREHVPERLKVSNGDKFFTALIGQYGKSKYHNDIKPAVYRVHPGGIWSKISQKERVESLINTYFWMYKYFTRVGQTYTAKVYWNRYQSSALSLFDNKALVKESIKRFLLLRTAKRLVSKLLKRQIDEQNR